MKISIEIDGKTIEGVEAEPATLPHLGAEPPPELLAAARRLGAQSAGIAAFSMPAGEPTGEITVTEAVVTTIALPDTDAGPAPGLEPPRDAAAAPTGQPEGAV
jgi:hypothetical protein